MRMNGSFIRDALTKANNGLRQAILTWLGLSAPPARYDMNVYGGRLIHPLDADYYQTMLTKREDLFRVKLPKL